MAWWPRLREYLTLRAATVEAERRDPNSRARARRALALAKQRRAAAEALWASGHSAEGLRLMRQALTAALEAAAALRTSAHAPPAEPGPEGAPSGPPPEPDEAAEAAEHEQGGSHRPDPAAWAELTERGVKEARLAELREAAALERTPELDDDVSAADARAFHRLSEATALVARTLANATRTPAELRRLRRRRWAGLAGALLAVAALGALKIQEAIQEANAPWIGRYYPGLDFQGTPELRGDLRLAFDWGPGAPMPGLPTDRFTVRWDSCLVLDADDTVSFAVRSDDGHRLYVDDELVLDHWSPQPARWASERRALTAGPHHVRLEYFEQGGNARVALRLEGASGDLQAKLQRPTAPDGGCR